MGITRLIKKKLDLHQLLDSPHTRGVYNYDRRGPIVVSRVVSKAWAPPVNIADDQNFEEALKQACWGDDLAVARRSIQKLSRGEVNDAHVRRR